MEDYIIELHLEIVKLQSKCDYLKNKIENDKLTNNMLTVYQRLYNKHNDNIKTYQKVINILMQSEMHNENNILIWLERRIKTTELERDFDNISKELLIGKGAKLTAYKEVYNYIKNH